MFQRKKLQQTRFLDYNKKVCSRGDFYTPTKKSIIVRISTLRQKCLLQGSLHSYTKVCSHWDFYAPEKKSALVGIPTPVLGGGDSYTLTKKSVLVGIFTLQRKRKYKRWGR